MSFNINANDAVMSHRGHLMLRPSRRYINQYNAHMAIFVMVTTAVANHIENL